MELNKEAIEKIVELANSARKVTPVAEAPVLPGFNKPIVQVPTGFELKSLDDFAPQPDRIEETTAVSDSESFISYVNRFKTSGTVVFSSYKNFKITARLDFHTDGKTPSWNRHACELVLLKSQEQLKLEIINNKPLDQEDFIEFLEEMKHTVTHPDSATLQEIILKFESIRTVTFKSKISRTDGGVNLTYSDEKNAELTTKVPDYVGFLLPMFVGGKLIQYEARLNYKVSAGEVKFKIIIDRLDAIKRTAFNAIREEIESGTSVPNYLAP